MSMKEHADNLISPCNDHCIQSLNEHHVKEHAESFEKNFKPYNTLIGHICDNVSTNDLMTPGKFWAETMHTRAALQRLVKSSDCTQKREISVCLYGRLSKFDPGSGSVSCF